MESPEVDSPQGAPDVAAAAAEPSEKVTPPEAAGAESEQAEGAKQDSVEPEAVDTETPVNENPGAGPVNAESVNAEAATEEAPAPQALPEALLPDELLPEDLLPEDESQGSLLSLGDAKLKAVLEAIIYVTDEPLSLDQICAAIEQPRERVVTALEQLAADYEQEDRGLTIREIAGGFRMTTKPEHHEAVRRFVKNLNPPLKLSLPALETLAVIAYKQPITAPEIMEIRGVQGAGVLKTLIDRKLIATAGRKQVVGKPILYKTTREFLVQFGLKDLAELPTLKEFQEIGRLDTEGSVAEEPAPAEPRENPPVQEPPPQQPPVQEPPVEEPPAEPPPAEEEVEPPSAN